MVCDRVLREVCGIQLQAQIALFLTEIGNCQSCSSGELSILMSTENFAFQNCFKHIPKQCPVDIFENSRTELGGGRLA